NYTLSTKILYMHSRKDFEAILLRCTIEGQPRDILGTYWPGGDKGYAGDIADWRRIFRMVKHPLIWVGDLNAHHMGLFNSPDTNNRGHVVEQLMDEYNLVKLSHGNTWHRPHFNPSEIDVALVSQSLVGEIKWNLYTDSLGSDHTPGILQIQGARVKGPVYKVDW